MRFLRLLNFLLTAITLIAFAAPYTSPSDSWLVYLSGISFSWLFLGHIIFIIWWLWRRKIYWMISVATLFLGFEHVRNSYGLAFNNSNISPDFRVLTFNMHIGSNEYTQMSADKARKIHDFLVETNADIICLQEIAILNRVAKDRITQLGLFEQYPYWHKSEKVANVILSKYPIAASGELPLGDYGNGCIYADVNVGNKTMRVYDMHLHSNRVTGETNRIVDEAKRANGPTASAVEGVASKVARRAQTRAQQAIAIAQHAAQFQGPNLICGDMNETPVTFTYATLSRGRTDAFVAYGFGLGTTYAGRIPFLRIDYQLASLQIEVLSYRKLHPDFSDHYPVLVGYRFAP